MASTQETVLVSWRVFDRFPPPIDTSVTLPASQYPAGAIERVEMGDTYLSLILDDNGNVVDDRVIFSSGYPDLDEKAMEVIKGTRALAGFPAGHQNVRATWMPPEAKEAGEFVVVMARRGG